jgi:CheY-like chemotaxis protein
MPVRKNPLTKLHAHILMVDDNAHGLTARRTVLEEQGYRVTTARNALEALERFRESKFDLVVTDYKMPKMDGLELIADLRMASPEVPIILLSGFVDAMGLTEQSTGADGVIQKSSHEVSYLIRMVARLLTRKVLKRKPATSGVKPSNAKRQSAN